MPITAVSGVTDVKKTPINVSLDGTLDVAPASIITVLEDDDTEPTATSQSTPIIEDRTWENSNETAPDNLPGAPMMDLPNQLSDGNTRRAIEDGLRSLNEDLERETNEEENDKMAPQKTDRIARMEKGMAT